MQISTQTNHCFGYFFIASVMRCIVHKVPLTSESLTGSLLQILETLEEVPWSRFENLQMQPAVSKKRPLL